MIDQDKLRELYAIMSIGEIAKLFGVSRSSIYYHAKKMGLKTRSKSEAQSLHLSRGKHQRTGKKHTTATIDAISDATKIFWESERGSQLKGQLSTGRREAWLNLSSVQRQEILERMRLGDRPKAGSLSKLGIKLVEFLSGKEQLEACVRLTGTHVSDIILSEHMVVIELLLPIYIYGQEQTNKTELRYRNLAKELNDLGYRVFVVEDKSNSISIARCKRIYSTLKEFITSDETFLKIIS